MVKSNEEVDGLRKELEETGDKVIRMGILLEQGERKRERLVREGEEAVRGKDGVIKRLG